MSEGLKLSALEDASCRCRKDASYQRWKTQVASAGRMQVVSALEKMQVASPVKMQVVSAASCWNERWLDMDAGLAWRWLGVGAGSGVGAVLAWRGSNKAGQHIPGTHGHATDSMKTWRQGFSEIQGCRPRRPKVLLRTWSNNKRRRLEGCPKSWS